MNRDNLRLVWELQTINEVAEGIAQSLELDNVLVGALRCLTSALDVVGGSIRLRNEKGDTPRRHSSERQPARLARWPDAAPKRLTSSPTDPYIVDDMRDGLPPGWTANSRC